MSSDQNNIHESEPVESAAGSVESATSTPPVATGCSDEQSHLPRNRPNSRNSSQQQHQHSQLPSMPPIFHPYPPHPPSGHYGPYSMVMGKTGSAYHHPPPGQGPPPQSTVAQASLLSPPRHGYDREDHNFHRPIPVRPNDGEYRGPYASGSYAAPPDDRRWMAPEASGHQTHAYPVYDGQIYSKAHPQTYHPPAPLTPHPLPPGHMPYHYPPHHVYPGNRYNEKSMLHGHQQPNSTETCETDAREGATSPSQIELSHRDEVTSMGCTCKKTKCLKLYCQCFAVKIYCGPNCRCLVCFNTTKHEQARNDAMRSILTRNPAAFDTKFSKTKERKAKEQQSVLAHKLGCKCRKSACMKKYCECYAGNVKCSPNCRCVGCKNTTSVNFGPGKPDPNLSIREGAVVTYDLPVPHGGRSGREPWMMNAAQNLAFLKHGSPTGEKSTAHVHDAGEVASMPSLAATSSDTSPEDKAEDAMKGTHESSGETSGPVNSLLIAAMAMTEFQSRKSEKSHTHCDGSEVKNAESLAHQDKEECKGLRPSPKRKSSDRVEDDETTTETKISGEVASSEGHQKSLDASDSESPLDPRELKRTRLGSVRKKMTWEQGGAGKSDTPDALMKEKALHGKETPKSKASGTDTLTPISARCIDFKKIHF